MKKININLSYEEILKRKDRWDKTINFKKADRIPVLHYIGARYWLPIIGYENRFSEYLNDPKTMLEAQLLGQKWIIENVKSDFHKIVLYPDFMWVEEASAFGAEIVFPKNDSPWVKRPNLLQVNDNLDQLRKIDYVNTGIHGKMLSFFTDMKKLAEDYEIRFSDGKVLSATDCVYMGGGGIIGPATTAGDLRGVEALSLDFYDRPDWVKELLDIIAEKSIEWLSAVIGLDNGKLAFCSDFNENFIHIGDDGIADMTPRQVEEFMLNPLKKLSDYVHKQGMMIQGHNCGKADHVLKYWMEDIGIDRYIGFSYLIDKNLIKKIMGGKIVLMGGIDTIKLHEGKSEEVIEDVRYAIEVLKDTPGYIIMDGHNIAPGTPLENLNAVTEAAEKFGKF
jgi:uroporphyrinogen decarboxylase